MTDTEPDKARVMAECCVREIRNAGDSLSDAHLVNIVEYWMLKHFEGWRGQIIKDVEERIAREEKERKV